MSADEFDYSALRWDFGDAGRRALARLERSDNPRVAELARLARKQTERTYVAGRGGDFRSADEIDVRVQPDEPELRRMVIEYLRANAYVCQEFCVALDLAADDEGRREIALVENGRYIRVALPAGTPERPAEVAPAAQPAFGPSSAVEIRTVPERYIFVDGRKIGPAIGEE